MHPLPIRQSDMCLWRVDGWMGEGGGGVGGEGRENKIPFASVQGVCKNGHKVQCHRTGLRHVIVVSAHACDVHDAHWYKKKKPFAQ